jgi:hypothetical protein
MSRVAMQSSVRAEVTAVVLGYIDPAGVEQWVDMTDVAVLPFETCGPVRVFPSYRGQLKNPGLWWSSTNSRHVRTVRGPTATR